MVHFVTTLTEEEARSFLEYLASLDPQGAVMHTSGSLRVRFSVEALNAKAFSASSTCKVAVTWTKTTSRVQIQAGAAVIDALATMIEDLAKVYASALLGEVLPPPSGCEKAAANFQVPPKPSFKRISRESAATHEGLQSAVHVPRDPGYHEAIAHLVEEAKVSLNDHPVWKNKFLAIMIAEFGAKSQQAFETVGDDDDDDWEKHV